MSDEIAPELELRALASEARFQGRPNRAEYLEAGAAALERCAELERQTGELQDRLQEVAGIVRSAKDRLILFGPTGDVESGLERALSACHRTGRQQPGEAGEARSGHGQR